MDAARVALRLGAKEVSIVYRRSRAEMPAARKKSKKPSTRESSFILLANPTRILTQNGSVTGMQCIKNGARRAGCQRSRRPIPIKGTEFTWA